MNPYDLAVQLRSWLLRPRVIHRLPGRLRLRIPALKQVDGLQAQWALAWRDVLGGMAEIHSVQVNLTTGSALIGYDPAALSEAELLEFLRAVNRLALRHWEKLAATPANKLPRVLKRLVRVIRRATRHRLVLDDRIEIPEDVWA
jgi:copper chaperone CopZ